ncbi:MAG: efflux RND transporter periplasmic adaptor subunit, partial [Alcaligenaceae bacterium]|nr:efflux RND transporter periplasmic adaptor subunit [Alcaligenaceae bacterium]
GKDEAGGAASAQGGPPPVPVSTVKVEPAATQIFTTLSGRIEAIKDAQVRARVTGIIESIEFEQGSQVKEGQLLFKIDPAIYQAAVNQAAAALEQAQANAKSASLLAKRYSSLVKSAAVSRQEYDNAIAQAAQAEASISQAKAALEAAKIDLGYTEVRSPIDGIIGEAFVTEGALVSAANGTHLATVQQLDQVYVDFSQTTNELSQLRKAMAEGQLKQAESGTAIVQLEMGDGSVYPENGKLLFTGITVNPTTGQVTLRSVFPNPDHILLPGMFAQVRLEQGVNPQALAVPSQALQRSPDGTVRLLLVKDQKAVSVAVQEGTSVDGKTIINKGLSPNDEVIVEGFQKAQPGATVNPMPWKKAGNTEASAKTSEPAKN